MRRDGWMLRQLPVGMVEDDFFRRFLGIFQELGDTVLDGVDNLDNVVDVTVAPEPVVRWLGTWLGVHSIDDSMPHELQRRVVRASARMLPWRGTRRGLQDFLELISGAPATVEDSGGVFPEGTSPEGPPWVRLQVQSTGWLTDQDFVELVRDEVPAFVEVELLVGDRIVWSSAEQREART